MLATTFETVMAGGEGQDFLVKMGGSPYRGVVYRGGGGKHCFPLIVYEICSSNALYSACLSFRMFIFILTSFDTCDCYYFGLNLSLMLFVKVFFIKKKCNVVFSLLKMKK